MLGQLSPYPGPVADFADLARVNKDIFSASMPVAEVLNQHTVVTNWKGHIGTYPVGVGRVLAQFKAPEWFI